jgi:hypothetical protein
MKTLPVKRILPLCITFSAAIAVIALAALSPAAAAENWKAAFDDVCGNVQNAESMSEKEISAMVEKADKLLPVIQASDDPARKVYLTRLKKCRGVYEFMLDTKKGSGQ